MGISIRDMAAQLGVSKSQVARDKADGMPMTDAEAARAWRERHRDIAQSVDGRIDRPTIAAPRAGGGLASAAGAGGADTPPASSGDDLAEDAPELAPTDTAEYRRLRTDRERIRRDREQLDLDRERGLVVDAAEAARLAFTVFRAVRDQVLNAGPRLAPQFAALADPAVIGELYESEMVKLFGAFDESRILADPDDGDDEAG